MKPTTSSRLACHIDIEYYKEGIFESIINDNWYHRRTSRINQKQYKKSKPWYLWLILIEIFGCWGAEDPYFGTFDEYSCQLRVTYIRVKIVIKDRVTAKIRFQLALDSYFLYERRRRHLHNKCPSSNSRK